jgi:hypothetical protein
MTTPEPAPFTAPKNKAKALSPSTAEVMEEAGKAATAEGAPR